MSNVPKISILGSNDEAKLTRQINNDIEQNREKGYTLHKTSTNCTGNNTSAYTVVTLTYVKKGY